ncbi:hypothetical protein FKW77_005730 [Venturia effusa]|uniref:UBA domain-containing protein n=1 Tax=Venturia effusa TaxID=50376 RepID=A0A517LLJ4_9PEZI|nr:hypothetical protein FKW77_005730 [Venturia effusa]
MKSNGSPQEQGNNDKNSLESQLDMQYKELAYFKDFSDQAIRDIATIQKNEVVERVWIILLNMAARFSQASKDISGIQALPVYAQKQVSPPSNLIHAPVQIAIQQGKQEFVDEMLSFGFDNRSDVVSAFELADGNKELALNILTSGVSIPPTPQSQVQDTSYAWDVSPPSQSTRAFNSQDAGVDEAPLTPKNRKRKADSPITNTSPSLRHYANTPIHSPAPSSGQTSAQTPATPRPTRSPFTPGGYLARRKPSSMSSQERSALLAIVLQLAPSNKVSRFWEKVKDSLARAGFKKSEAAWKGEWSRYGAYEHGFDERTGKFVESEVEKLKLLRCLDNKPRAEVNRAIQELEEEEEEVIFVGSVKRQKMTGGFEGIDGGIFSANGQSSVDGSGFPPHDYTSRVEYVDETETPASQEPSNKNSPAAFEQHNDEVQNFGHLMTSPVEVEPHHNDTWPIGSGFDLEDSRLVRNTGEWLLNVTEQGIGHEFDFENGIGNNLGVVGDLSAVGGLNSEEENPYVAAYIEANIPFGY